MTDINQYKSSSSRTKIFLYLLPLLVFGALIGLFFTAFSLREAGLISEPGQVPSVLINKPVPEFTLPPIEFSSTNTLDLQGFSNADLTNKISIVNVWASWCVPCRAEHPSLMKLSNDDRTNVFGINYKDKSKNAEKFLTELGNPYQAVGVDDSGLTSIDWGVYGVPETFIVSPTGIILYKFIGPITEQALTETFLPQLEKVLKSNNQNS